MMRDRTRRGSIAAVLIILAGARDQDLTARRLDTARAFRAAEAGANTAIREVMAGVDAAAPVR